GRSSGLPRAEASDGRERFLRPYRPIRYGARRPLDTRRTAGYATGKSIALQMLKLAQEYPAIKRTMLDFAYNPSRDARSSSLITWAKTCPPSGRTTPSSR